MEEAIRVQDLTVSYYGNEAITNVSFTFNKKRLIGIIGPNGAGKSTLMKAILHLIPKDKGEITFSSQPLKAVQKKIAYVPQRSEIDWDFPITVLDTVLLGTYPRLSLFQRPSKHDRTFAYHCLERVNMQAYSDRQIGELSGGQQQRVFLARALAQKAEYFFLDEPFVGIDVSSESTIIEILKQLRDGGKTVFVVHHDLSKVEQYFDELILMNKKLIASGPVEDVFQPALMKKAYEVQLPFLREMEVQL